MRHAGRRARVDESDSETPYTTSRAMDFIAETGERPWCLHLSYINKPHWPYIAPAPYHDLYGAADVIPAIRSAEEQRDPHPIYKSFMNERVSRVFSRDDVRETVIPVYMGLIKQIDDQIRRLIEFLERQDRLKDTLIVFTSDHGDYLGDHWLGEKELFHDVSVRVPLIVVDPDPAADGTRGTTCDALVEMIDLPPTFLDVLSQDIPRHRLEGHSILPFLLGKPPRDWRQYVISEYDYSFRLARTDYGVAIQDCHMVMVADERWSYIHVPHFPPLLFDRMTDPHEFIDHGRDPAFAEICQTMKGRLLEWATSQRQRTTISDAAIESRIGKEAAAGILIGFWDEDEPKAYN